MWLRRVRTTGLLALLLGGSAPLAAENPWNMPVGVTEISRQVYDLHMLIFGICVLIGAGVFGVMIYSLIQHRRTRHSDAAQFHESTSVEVIWTLIPFLIIVGMAIPATKTLIAMEDTRGSDLTIQATGYQWKWEYSYLEEDISFFSNLATSRKAITNEADKGANYLLEVDNDMVVPVGAKVRLLVTSNDVLHAWWVPDLAVKKDAIPGFINETWFRVEEPGTYRGQCAELCGKDHGFMPIVVTAKAPAEYREWVAVKREAKFAALAAADREWSMTDLMAKGERVYNTNCAACHQGDGEGVPGVFPPISGNAIATGPLESHLDVIMNGRTGTAMQAFGQQLNDVELAAVVTYQRNAWANETGDVVQPARIKAAR
jgi:cytochrome c oxidase subunit 2